MNTTHYKRHILDLPEMDSQHTYLYLLFDSIEEYPAPSDSPRIKLLLAEIERYIMFHFISEENLMKSYKFPGFAVHQSAHESAANKLIAFMDDFDAGRLNSAALKIFLTGWLMDHSVESDNEYAVWIRNFRSSNLLSSL